METDGKQRLHQLQLQLQPQLQLQESCQTLEHWRCTAQYPGWQGRAAGDDGRRERSRTSSLLAFLTASIRLLLRIRILFVYRRELVPTGTPSTINTTVEDDERRACRLMILPPVLGSRHSTFDPGFHQLPSEAPSLSVVSNSTDPLRVDIMLALSVFPLSPITPRLIVLFGLALNGYPAASTALAYKLRQLRLVACDLALLLMRFFGRSTFRTDALHIQPRASGASNMGPYHI
ncbi:hypothetical protein CSOJ01_11299 [Colletotrichum sojae]|uniref:Uncharacterized protein n=1 Tax=Colletotrichum sojae TaxID=2175907 RepID=A0A8H6IYL8_9PEZI|nr:hypothetical protein CSOJ01_11299 [Colletotrichum sojae]